MRSLSECAAAASAEARTKALVSAHREGPWLRLYASSYEALARAQEAILAAASETKLHAEERPERFDHDRDVWVPVDLPKLSERDAERVQTHEGAGQWGASAGPDRLTIHFELDSRHKAAQLAERLATEGFDVHRHWTYVFVFVENRQAADALLESLDGELRREAYVSANGERTFVL
jgi:hypothetical protein